MQKENKKVLTAIILALISCMIWAVHNVAARGIHDWINPVEYAFWRWVIAFLILAPFTIKNFKKNFVLMKQNIGLFIWIGLISHVIYNVLFYASAHFTSANNLSLLTTTSFIWTISLGALFKVEIVTKEKLIGAFVAMIGVLIVITKADLDTLKNFQFNTGDMILIVACFGWGIYSLLIKLKPAGMDQSFMLAANIFFGIIFLIPLYIIEQHIAGYEVFTVNKFIVFGLTGFFASVIAWGFYNNSVHVIGPARTSMIYFLLPVFTSVVAYFALGEKLHGFHIAGFILIVSGIVISNLKRKPVFST